MRLQAQPVLFQQHRRPEIADLIDEIANNETWLDYVKQASQIHLIASENILARFQDLLEKNIDSMTQAIIYAGISRYYKASGDLLKAVQALGYANSLLDENATVDVVAFVSMEMAIVLSVTGNLDMSQVILDNIMQSDCSDLIKKYANFRQIENKMRQNQPNLLEDFLESLRYFEKENIIPAIINHHKAIGNVLRRGKNYDKATEYYVRGIEMAFQHNYDHLVQSLEHDLAMLDYHLGKHNDATQRLEEIYHNSKNHYVKCVVIANAGFIQFKTGNLGSAMKNFQQSLNIATEHGVYHRITGCCFYLGKIHATQNNLELAHYYFNQGYHAAMTMVENKFPCHGDTLLAIKGYHDFAEKNSDVIHKKSENWDDLIGKSFAEMKRIFQSALVDDLLQKYHTKRNVAKKLEISERNLFKILDKKRLSGDIIPDSIMEFVRENTDANWKDLNTKFESSILDFMLIKNQHNKRELAEKLQMSYSGVVKKLGDKNA